MNRSDALRITTFDRDPAVLAEQCGENARDANAALDARVRGYLKPVLQYRATGATTTQIPLTAASAPPAGVLLVRAALTSDRGADVPASSRLNFYFEKNAIGVFEPGGLVADSLYDLTFLILE